MLTMSSDLRYYKVNPEVRNPYRATSGSACFDLYSFLQEDSEVIVYRNDFEETEKVTRAVRLKRVPINPKERILIPTGLILDIPKGYSVRLYPRSSLALKQGLTLANNVGIIDEDYVEECNCIMINIGHDALEVCHGDRIAQAELRRTEYYSIEKIQERPQQKTDRDGGFGSTGT